jgi:hypothetical protein
MISFIIGTLFPMLVAGLVTHIAKGYYDEHVKPLVVGSSAEPTVQPQQEVEVSEQTTELTLRGFKRTGTGYTAVFE